jgi:hypothetical protein
MRTFNDRDGHRWTVDAGAWGDDAPFIAFVALDGKDRPRTLTLSEYVTDLSTVSDEQLRIWLDQSTTHNGSRSE